MYISDLPKLLNDDLSESKKINLSNCNNFNKTITSLIKSNSKLNEIITRYEEHEIRANLLRKTNDKFHHGKNKTCDLNYNYYKSNYSNWVEGIKNNIIEKDKLRSSSNNLSSTIIRDSSIKRIKSKSNKIVNIRKNSWSNLNKSNDKNLDDTKMGHAFDEIKPKELKFEDDVEIDEKKNNAEDKGDSNYTFWKFNHDESDSLLRKIYDKKLIIDLKLVKDAHTEHLEKMKCKNEKNAPNMQYIKEKIDKTKQKILFIKGIVDYAYPNIMIEKAKSLDKMKKSKSKNSQISLINNREIYNKSAKFFLTKSSSAFYSTSLYKNADKRTSTSFNPHHKSLLNTFSSSKLFFREKNCSIDKKVKVFTPIKINSFTPVMD